MIEGQACCCQNKVELAIQLLERQYQQRLSIVHFINTIEVFESSSKASIFITLQSGDICDLWLERYTNVQLIDITK